MDPPGEVPPSIAQGLHAPVDGPPPPPALEINAVKRLATEQNYDIIYYSRDTKLISFQPIPSDDIDDDSHEVRVNVYWNTGTVGTCFDHPTEPGVKTQLFRRNVELNELRDIFVNPRVDNSGAGYYETMELDGDATSDQMLLLSNNGHGLSGDDHNNHINLLQETNQMLREHLNDSAKIVISGRDGFPIYAEGGFRDGRWMSKRGGLWGVDLTMANSTNEEGEAIEDEIEVPISALEDIEIRLGGVLYASSQSHKVISSQMMEEQDWDNGNGKEVLCHFGGPVTGVWLPIRITGWPQSDWSQLQRKDFARRRNEYRENLDVYEVLLEEVVAKYPTATLAFHRLSFFGTCVEQMVDNLGLAPQLKQSDASKDGEQGENGLWNIANLIVSNLRSAGNDDVGEAFMKRVNDLQMAAYMMLTINKESAEVVEAEIPALVMMQLESDSTADFLSEVRGSYDITPSL